jgi:hypothetical protein
LTAAQNLDHHRALIEACLRLGVYFTWRGPGALLIAQPGAKGVLDDVVGKGYRVLGYDGFELDGADIHPRLDLIYDAERRPDISDPAAVVEGWPPVWVDVVLGPK